MDKLTVTLTFGNNPTNEMYKYTPLFALKTYLYCTVCVFIYIRHHKIKGSK